MTKKNWLALLALILFLFLLIDVFLDITPINREIKSLIYFIVVILFAWYAMTNHTKHLQEKAEAMRLAADENIDENEQLNDEYEEFELHFNKDSVYFSVPKNNILKSLHQNDVEYDLVGEASVIDSLDNPIDSERIENIVKPGEKIVIITSDITRPMPSKIVVPILVNRLLDNGISADDITIVFALGSHRKHTVDEQKYLVGEEIYNKIRCIDSDMNECENFGKTSIGTPVDIFNEVANADRRICLGNIEYHYFAGYSGGAKAIMPGVSSRDAIQANHSNMVNESAAAGRINGNPVRQDIEEVIQKCPIDFIVNVVLDENKQIVKTVSGHYISAHRVGCDFLDKMYKAEIPEKADIVITTPGGYPKDINLYQAQKSLDNAKHAVKDGGIVILVASCYEGLGEKVFEQWYNEADCPDELINRVSTNFELGGHKAAAIALVMKKAKIYLVSDLEPNFVENLFMKPFANVQEAVDDAMEHFDNKASIIVMPSGGSTLPFKQ